VQHLTTSITSTIKGLSAQDSPFCFVTEEEGMRSDRLIRGYDRAPARAMLKAVGFTDEDLRKPLIGVANTWIEIGPCNFHLRRLAARVKEGIREAGATPMEFNTVSISDGITMGSEGMKTSLISREVIADSVELVARGNAFDAVIALSGCDKTIPGTIMALARLDIPGLMLYGGSIAPGRFEDRDVTIQDVFEAVGAYKAGRMSEEAFQALENAACPGAGACGGQFTANTMATAAEFLGIAPMGSGSVPAAGDEKDEVARAAGRLVVDLLRRGVTARQILTREALENAIASVAASGGSTNAVLHLLAIAQEAGVPLAIDDFDRISRQTPLLADLKPGGRFVAHDLYQRRRHAPAGPPSRRGRLPASGRGDGDRPLARRRSGRGGGDRGQEVVRPLENPLQPNGGLAILKGNLAPEGCVVKIAGHQMRRFSGPARVFDTEEDAFAAVQEGLHPAGRRRRHPLRRAARRARHARDARRHRRHQRRRPGGCGRAAHRWPFLRRHPRP
jgi:dihydroxy-acid dehydratase